MADRLAGAFGPRRRLLLLFIIIGTCFAGPTGAQRYPIRTYTESDGLPTSAVMDVTQDRAGRMWFATRFGIASYDGWEWTRYDTKDGLPLADQRCILSDHVGRMWAVGDYCRAAVFEDDKWTALPTFQAKGSYFGPAAAIVPRAGDALLLVAPKEGGTSYFWGGEWHALPLPAGCGERVYDIASDGRLAYLATDTGVLTVDPNRPEPAAEYLEGVPRRRTGAVSFDDMTETLWVAGPDFVGKVVDNRFELVRDGVAFQMTDVYDYLVCEPDLLGGLYVGNPSALYRCDKTGCEVMGRTNGLAANSVTALRRDREGNMWVTSLRGVSKVVSLRFANYASEHGLEDNEVTAVLERSDGVFVLGHRTGFTFMGDDVRTLSLPRKVEARVLDLAEDASGNVWAAVYLYGLASIGRDGELRWHTSADGLDERVTSVLAASDGSIWATTTTNTFVRRENGFRERPGGVKFATERGGYLRRLFEGRDGTIYAISSGGLFVVRGEEILRIQTDTPERANNIFAFWEDDDGTLWLGTRIGLFVAGGTGITKVVEPGPRIDRPVYFIVADGRNFLWFGTDNGVMRWDGASLQHITIDDGLVGRETNRAAGVLDSRGRLWIGMDRGVSVYRPQLDAPHRVPPLVELAEVDVNGRLLPLDRKLELGSSDNTLLFRFRAMSFTDESKVQFQAWLEGFDETWLAPSREPDRELRYTNVPPGSYTFHLRAAGADGPWSETVSSAAIVIDAPLWEQPQFIVMMIALAALAVFTVAGYVSQRRYARRLEAEVKERIEELKSVEAELERSRRIETLGGLAGGIADDFNNLLTIILGNLSLLAEDVLEGGRDHVDDALAAAKRARGLTRRLLAFSRGGPPIKRTGSIAHVIEESAAFVTSGSTGRCEIDLPGDLYLVDIDAGQMSHVVNDLMLNARQSMPNGGVIRVSGRNHDAPPRPSLGPGRYVEIVIQDSGVGISSEDLDRVFDPYFSTREEGGGLGLTTAYSIVKRHDGLLSVDSAPGVGTTCRIFLPASQHTAVDEFGQRPAPAAGGARILVMDDETAVRELVGRMLERSGYTVDFARDGEEAVAMYKMCLDAGRRYDVVLLDLTVPGALGGKEVLKALRKQDPHVKAIAAGGDSNDPAVAAPGDQGFYGRVGKPFSAKELNRLVGEALAASGGDSNAAS